MTFSLCSPHLSSSYIAKLFQTFALLWNVVDMPSDTLLGKLIFPFPASVNVKQFHGQRWDLSSSFSQFWDKSGLNECWPCICCHILCELICSPILLCMEDTASLESSINRLWILSPLPHRSLNIEGRSLMKNSSMSDFWKFMHLI